MQKQGTFSLLVFVLTFAASASAQERLAPAWSELRSGALLRVRHSDTATTIGRLRSANESRLQLTGPCTLQPSLSCEASKIEINLRSVREAMVSRRRVGPAALKGAVVGAGIGFLLGFAVSGSDDSPRLKTAVVSTGIIGGFGAAAGGLVGALVPSWKRLPPPLLPE